MSNGLQTPQAPQSSDDPQSLEARPSWDEYFMQIARDVSTRATCLRRKVGAVVVRNKRILSTGYNGSPPGQPHCTQVGCLMEDGRCIRTLHAEQNALIQAALHGVSTDGATLYGTCRPCHVCARMIVGAGIRRVVFAGDMPEGWALTVLTGAGVELVQMPGPSVAEMGDEGEGEARIQEGALPLSAPFTANLRETVGIKRASDTFGSPATRSAYE